MFAAFANFSAALQLLFILNFRWTVDDLIKIVPTVDDLINGTSP